MFFVLEKGKKKKIPVGTIHLRLSLTNPWVFGEMTSDKCGIGWPRQMMMHRPIVVYDYTFNSKNFYSVVVVFCFPFDRKKFKLPRTTIIEFILCFFFLDSNFKWQRWNCFLNMEKMKCKFFFLKRMEFIH